MNPKKMVIIALSVGSIGLGFADLRSSSTSEGAEQVALRLLGAGAIIAGFGGLFLAQTFDAGSNGGGGGGSDEPIGPFDPDAEPIFDDEQEDHLAADVTELTDDALSQVLGDTEREMADEAEALVP